MASLAASRLKSVLSGAHRRGDLAAHLSIDRIGQMLAGASVEALHRSLPALKSCGVARADRAPARQDRFRHLEGRLAPAEPLARAFDLFLAKWRTMGRGGALLGRRAIADDGAAGDERRPVGHRLRILDGEHDRFRIVTVDPRRVPARRPEALELVVGH